MDASEKISETFVNIASMVWGIEQNHYSWTEKEVKYFYRKLTELQKELENYLDNP